MGGIANLKIWVRLTGAIWIMLVVAWSSMIIWESRVNRATAKADAEAFAREQAEAQRLRKQAEEREQEERDRLRRLADADREENPKAKKGTKK